MFQNALLIQLLKQELSKDFTLYFHQQVPPNDEHIALGQLVYYDHNMDGIQQRPAADSSISQTIPAL